MSLPSPEPTPTTADVTVALIHGASADASSWNGVIPVLQQRGATVVAPADLAAVMATTLRPLAGRALEAVVQPAVELPQPRGQVKQQAEATL